MEKNRLYMFLLFLSIIIVFMVYINGTQIQNSTNLKALLLDRTNQILSLNTQDDVNKSQDSNGRILPVATVAETTTAPKTTEALYEKLLKNPNDVILRYINLPYDYKYGSNSIPMAVSALLAEGDFLELGLGMFSTPLLHKIAVDKNVKAYSIDTQHDWAIKFNFYNLTDNHLVYIMNMNEMNKFGLDKKWGLVLVDHLSGETRYTNMINFANISQIVIGHDAEKQFEHYYKYESGKVRSHFKYACKFSIYDQTKSSYISTLVLSNFIDVTKFKVIFDKVKSDFGHVSCDDGFK